MITLFQFNPLWGLPNASAFCFKVENYLRMIDMPYDTEIIRDPRKAPKGKVPFIKDGDNIIGDSELIIEYLKNQYGDPLDKNLNEHQKAMQILLENLFSEKLYWIMVYMRWQDEAGWRQCAPVFFRSLTRLWKLFLPKIVRKKMIKALYIQGTGRHQRLEVIHMGIKVLDAIAAILDNNNFFLGKQISSIDATAFAFLANIVWLPYEDVLKTHAFSHQNIVLFCDRMWDFLYPEMQKPFAL